MSNKTEQGAMSERDEVADLVKRAQDGERAAFDDLVRHFQRPVFAMAYRMLAVRLGNQRTDSADSACDVFSCCQLFFCGFD